MKVLFGESDSLENKMFIESTGDLQNISGQKTTWSMETIFKTAQGKRLPGQWKFYLTILVTFR